MSVSANSEPGGRHYLAVFLLSLSVLMAEIAVARILSVALFSHYAFVAVSLAMFGLGVSGLVVYLRPEHFTRERLDEQLVTYGWRFALASVLSIVVFLRIHVAQEISLTGFTTLSLAYLVLALPFYFAGVCLSILMTHFAARIGRIYSVDLIGASLGCLGVVLAMSVLPAPQVVAWVATVVAGATLIIALRSTPRRVLGPAVALLVCVAVLVLGHTTDLLRMRYVKTWNEFYSEFEGWNAFSRIAIFPTRMNSAQLLPMKNNDYRVYDGDAYPKAMVVDIDGTAWTPVVNFDGDVSKIQFLRESVLYVGHQLRPNAEVLIIGIGGGRDLLAAKAFGQPAVVGIEINPMIRHVVQDVYGSFSGGPYTLPGVDVIIDEARSRLSTMDRRFDIIQLSLIDTFSLNAAGGFVFSENHLYTQEGFQEYFRHLRDDGILTISRYYMGAYPLEILRVAAMVREAWAAEGVTQPSAHVVVLAQGNTATLLAKRAPFTAAEMQRLDEVATANEMQVLYRPDRTSESPSEVAQVLTTPDLEGFLASYPFLIGPPTDNQPFFFHFLRGRLAEANIPSESSDPFQFLRKWHEAVQLLYLLIAVVTLLALAFFFGPLLILRRRHIGVSVGVALPLLTYFACLGYGFMMLEVPLLQHFTLLLGYPVYSLAVVLFALLLFSGLGSLLTSRIEQSAAASALTWVLAAVVGIATAYVYLLPLLIEALIGEPILLRIAATVAILAPIGVPLGMAYPLGITVLRGFSAELVPWAWGLNGALSVVASVLAIFIGSRLGFGAAFLTGVAAYVTALMAMRIAIGMGQPALAEDGLAAPRRSVANY